MDELVLLRQYYYTTVEYDYTIVYFGEAGQRTVFVLFLQLSYRSNISKFKLKNKFILECLSITNFLKGGHLWQLS